MAGSATLEVAAPAALNPATILLAEDETALRALLARILILSGYRVLAARDGVDARRIWKDESERIHMLITDVVMPQLGGRALARSLSEQQPSLKVLYISGYNEDQLVHHEIETNDIHFLEKPFTPTVLLTKVREILASG